MSCFSGDSIASTFTVEEWHSLESFFDSVTGKSPLMQLCRQIEDAYVTLGCDVPYAFHRVGSNPSDTSFGSVDYDSNPAWNPLEDIKQILTHCNGMLVAMHTSFCEREDCYDVKFDPDSDGYAAYLSAISGSSLSNKEDWLVFVNAMKDLLESMESAMIERDGWTEDYITYNGAQLSWGNSGVYGRFQDGSVHPYDDSADYPQMRYGKTGLDEYNLHASADAGCSRSYSDFDGTFLYTAKNVVTSPTFTYGVDEHYIHMRSLGAGFNNALFTHDMGDYYATQMTYNSISPNPGPPIEDYCDHPLSNLGWWTTEEYTFTYRVTRAGADFVSGEPHASDGYTVDWEVFEFQTDETNPISYTLSASSGTITWAEGQEYEDITITATLTDANVGSNWSSGDSVGSVVPFNKSVTLGITLSLAFDVVCVDACGNLHPKE